MKLTIVIGLLFSMSAFANDGFDCRSGSSPQGGKFCHYRISQCEANECVDAAQCAINEYSSQVTWAGVKNVKLVGVDMNASTLSFSVKTNKGSQVQTVTVEQNEESCKAVALKVN